MSDEGEWTAFALRSLNEQNQLRHPRRRRILEVGLRLFADHGYEKVTMRHISNEVACRQAALYLHFPNKQAIFAELCVETFSLLWAEIKAIESVSSDPYDCISRIYVALFCFGLRHQERFRIFLSQPSWNGVTAASYVRETSTPLRNYLKNLMCGSSLSQSLPIDRTAGNTKN